MKIRIPELKKEENKSERKPKILTYEYVKELNRGIAYRIRESEARTHASIKDEAVLSRRFK